MTTRRRSHDNEVSRQRGGGVMTIRKKGHDGALLS